MKRLRVPLSYPAPDGFDGVSQAACRGGSVAVESVAAFAWNGWQASSGISGNLGLEYAAPSFGEWFPHVPVNNGAWLSSEIVRRVSQPRELPP